MDVDSRRETSVCVLDSGGSIPLTLVHLAKATQEVTKATALQTNQGQEEEGEAQKTIER